MGAPVKRKRDQKDEPSASTSSQVVKQPAADVSWPWLLSGIQGTRGEPGAVEGQADQSMLQICLYSCIEAASRVYADAAVC